MVNDPFKALAHPVRREIVERLARGPATVGEVTRGFGVSKPAISRHLKILEEAGEVWLAAEHESDEALAEELSQLLYWAQVMMIARGLTLDDVYRKL